MKKLLLILLCLPIIGFGQNWEKTIQNGEPGINSLKQTSDGGFIFSGELNNEGYILKMDLYGNEEWTISTSSPGFCMSIEQTTDDGYVYIGYTNGEPTVYKINSSGTNDWSQTFTDFKLHSIKPTSDGGYIISGADSWNTSSLNTGFLLMKLDSFGNQQWIKYFSNNNCIWDTGDVSDVQQTSDGGYVLGCYCDESNVQRKAMIVKTDASGNVQWNNTYANSISTNYSYYYSIEQTNDGGYALCGFIRDNNSNPNLNFIKTNSSGTLEWNNTYGDFLNIGFFVSSGYSFQQTNDGGYIITGQDVEGNVDSLGTLLLLKLNPNGTMHWYKFFGGYDNINNNYIYTTGLSVRQTTDNGYIISGGSYNSEETMRDINIIKTDFQGNITSTFNIPLNPNRKLEKTVDILGKETKPQTNTPLIEIYDDGSTEKKIIIE